jgi:hypothetical protein
VDAWLTPLLFIPLVEDSGTPNPYLPNTRHVCRVPETGRAIVGPKETRFLFWDLPRNCVLGPLQGSAINWGEMIEKNATIHGFSLAFSLVKFYVCGKQYP